MYIEKKFPICTTLDVTLTAVFEKNGFEIFDPSECYTTQHRLQTAAFNVFVIPFIAVVYGALFTLPRWCYF